MLCGFLCYWCHRNKRVIFNALFINNIVDGSHESKIYFLTRCSETNRYMSHMFHLCYLQLLDVTFVFWCRSFWYNYMRNIPFIISCLFHLAIKRIEKFKMTVKIGIAVFFVTLYCIWRYMYTQVFCFCCLLWFKTGRYSPYSSWRVTSMALWQSYGCPCVGEATRRIRLHASLESVKNYDISTTKIQLNKTRYT